MAQILERGQAGSVVPVGIELQPVGHPDPAIRIRPELGPRTGEREVDVEEHRPQHPTSIARADAVPPG